jgi:hypothetical protein
MCRRLQMVIGRNPVKVYARKARWIMGRRGGRRRMPFAHHRKPYLFANAGRGLLESHTWRTMIPGTVPLCGPARPAGPPA